jgi:hypothetical protein
MYQGFYSFIATAFFLFAAMVLTQLHSYLLQCQWRTGK